MKPIIVIIFGWATVIPVEAEFVLPPEIVAGFVQSEIGESGGLFINGVDEGIFRDYVQKNWRLIIEAIDNLPTQTDRPSQETGLSLSSVGVLGAACEELPPLEYLDYLDRIIELFGKSGPTENALHLISGVEKKEDFLSVNWEHPRVKKILAKVRKLIPPDDVDLLSCIDDIASGALSDNYMYDESDDSPRPETLPGIKLKRPWDSLIKKYERMTGKKVEEAHDPQFNPRPEKRGGSSGLFSPDGVSSSTRVMSPAWLWVIGGLIITLSMLVWKLLRMRRA